MLRLSPWLKMPEHALAPYCQRIEIAGSIRRQRPQCGDVELVAIPRMIPDGLFGDELQVDPGFCAIVNQWPKIKGEPTARYTQRVLPGGILLDLFMTKPQAFGHILLIRTGDRAFSQWMMGTVLPRRGYQSRAGAIWHDGLKLLTPEEQDVFHLVGMEWIEPRNRGGPIRLTC